MAKRIEIHQIYGYCPFLEMEHAIRVRFRAEHYPRQPAPFFIPVDFACSHDYECTIGNDCPIYKQAEYP